MFMIYQIDYTPNRRNNYSSLIEILTVKAKETIHEDAYVKAWPIEIVSPKEISADDLIRFNSALFNDSE
jgi:hypothetical protein